MYNHTDNVILYTKGWKLEIGDKATPWTPHPQDELYSGMGLNGTTVYDVSGFQNNGTRIGTLNYTSNTPRHDVCTIFPSGSHVSFPITTAGFTNSYTICYWGEFTGNSQMICGSGDGNRLNLFATGGYFYHNTGDGSNNPFKDASNNNVSTSEYTNSIHHYAITGNGSVNNLYIDGVKKGTSTTYKPLNSSIMYINGWTNSASYNISNGRVSDFRIYATALSDADILELYNGY